MGQFVVGQSGNPVGRPKGAYGGRIQALASLDRILGKRKNLASRERALEIMGDNGDNGDAQSEEFASLGC